MCEDTQTGELIREYRKQRGLTQGELGERLGLTASTIMRYERGQRRVNIETLKRIAAALEVDPYSLMDFDTATEAVSDSIIEGDEYRAKIISGLDKLGTDGLKLVRELVEAIAGNPRYRYLADEELPVERDTAE